MKTFMLRMVFVLMLLSVSFALTAVTITGRVIANDEPEGLENAVITLVSADPVNEYDTLSDEDGYFTFENVEGEEDDGIDYVLNISYPVYQPHESQITVFDSDIELDVIRIDEIAFLPGNVVAIEDEEEDAVNLQWNTPIPGEPQWIHWDDGDNNDGIGAGEVYMVVASRFTPEQLDDLLVTGLSLTTVRFFPREAAADYAIKVYRGGSDDPYDPGVEVHSQDVTNPVIGEWNEIELSAAVEILPEEELWFGYSIDTPHGFPAGCDEGPQVEGFGNLIFFDGDWHTLTELAPALTFNWNIQGYAGFSRGDRSVAIATEPEPRNNRTRTSGDVNTSTNSGLLTLASESGVDQDHLQISRENRRADRTSRPTEYRVLEEYQVFRYNLVDQNEPDEWDYLATLEDTTYMDTGWSDLDAGYYGYAVRAVYTQDVISEPAFSNLLPKELRFNLTGRVIASDTHDGVENAEILLQGLVGYDFYTEDCHTFTDEDGYFEITDVLGYVEEIPYELTILSFGYQEHISIVNVTNIDLDIGDILIDELAFRARNLVAEESDEGYAKVTWETPAPSQVQWLHWDDGENYDSIGTGGPAQFQVAARFTHDNIVEMNAQGLFITAVKFFPQFADFTTFTIKVWRDGGSDPFVPGELITSQLVENVEDEEWNEVVLDDPVRIRQDQEIWIGYDIATEFGFPAGSDEGPAVEGYGNLISFGGEWATLTQITDPPISTNWNIQAYAGYDQNDRSIALGSPNQSELKNYKDINNDNMLNIDRPSTVSGVLGLASDNGHTPSDNWRPGRSIYRNERIGHSDGLSERVLEEYKLYRYQINDVDSPENWTEISTQTDTIFTDTDWENLDPEVYAYAVIAVYTNDVLSIPTKSNELPNRMEVMTVVQVSTNSGDPVVGGYVSLTNIDTTGDHDHQYSQEIPENGVVIFENVWRGTYDIVARLPGFKRYVARDIVVDEDVFEYTLEFVEDLVVISDLEYEVFNDNNVRLAWSPPGTVEGEEQWIHWDSGVNQDNAIGTGGPIEMMVAQRFTPDEIEELKIANLYLTKMKFFPFHEGATYTLKIWQGGSVVPAINSGREVLSQEVTTFTNRQWNTIDLDTPILISSQEEIWFGYNVSAPDAYPAACDNGPAVDRYGNLMFVDNQWTTLLSVNAQFDFNWNVHAYAGFLDGRDSQLVSRNKSVSERESSKSRELLGYKVIRDEEVIAENVEEEYYRDLSIPIGSYVYSVVAQYTTGDSDPVSTEDVIILNVEDENALNPVITELIGNYPNPFNPDTKISFSLATSDNVRLDIFNTKGQKIRTLVDSEMEAGYHTVIWDGRNDNKTEVGSGIYFYRMESDTYSTTRKMIMIK